MKERQVAITTRLALELERFKASIPDSSDGLVFGIIDNVKRSFTAARSKAGLRDVRFHDLRHYGCNASCGCSYSAVRSRTRSRAHPDKHSYRYVNANVETARRAAAVLDAFNGEATLNRSRSRW